MDMFKEFTSLDFGFSNFNLKPPYVLFLHQKV